MDLKQVRKLIRLMKANGVLSLKAEGVEITLAPESAKPAKPKIKENPIKETKLDNKFHGYTEEQVLFWNDEVGSAESK